MKLTNKAGRALGIPGARRSIVVERGQSVEIDQEFVDEIKANKTASRWLASGLLEIDGGASPPKENVKPESKPDEKPDGVPEEGIYIEHLGGGYYDVWVNGFKVTDEKVRGKKNAQKIADEYELPEE